MKKILLIVLLQIPLSIMAQTPRGNSKGLYGPDDFNPEQFYPVVLSEVETLAYMSQYKGYSHPIQETDIKYYILNDHRIIIYSELIKKGYMYPADYPFIESYNPSIVEHSPLVKDLQPEHFISMDKHLGGYLSDLGDILDFKIEIDNDDPQYLKQLSGRIAAYRKKNGHKKIFIPLFVYLGEKIRRECQGIWTLKLFIMTGASFHDVLLVDGLGREVKYYTGDLQEWLENKYESEINVSTTVSYVLSRSRRGK